MKGPVPTTCFATVLAHCTACRQVRWWCGCCGAGAESRLPVDAQVPGAAFTSTCPYCGATATIAVVGWRVPPDEAMAWGGPAHQQLTGLERVAAAPAAARPVPVSPPERAESSPGAHPPGQASSRSQPAEGYRWLRGIGPHANPGPEVGLASLIGHHYLQPDPAATPRATVDDYQASPGWEGLQRHQHSAIAAVFRRMYGGSAPARRLGNKGPAVYSHREMSLVLMALKRAEEHRNRLRR